MASTNFGNLAESLERIGFVDVLLPFLLIFTVIFAVLEKTKILGDGKLEKKFNISAHAFSKSAKTKIEAAGGEIKKIEMGKKKMAPKK